MTRITLTSDQLITIGQATDTIQLLNEHGELVGYLTKATESDELTAELAEAMRRSNSDGPWHTTAEVQEYLSKLEHE